uniref:Uncharacterized protein n=1 Tax=Glossina palpalis gambiensis TaxID=67801 RepID=A0A240SXF0_9MUSC
MKFFALLVVALLAATVSASGTRPPHVHNAITGGGAYYHFWAGVEGLMHALEEVIPEPWYHFIHEIYQYMQTVYEMIPNDLTNAFNNVWNTWPSYKQFFTPEFVNAAEELFHTMWSTFFPHEFYTVLENIYERFPKVTDLLPKEFLATLSKYLEHVPLIREPMKQWMLVMEQLMPHTHHH